MRNGEITAINGAWSDEEQAWVSETWFLTGDTYLEVALRDKGRIIVEKAETADGVWHKAMITPWSGPEYRIRIYGSTKYRYVKIYLTSEPTMIQFANTNGYAVRSL